MTEARQRHEITVELMQRTAALKQTNEELENEMTVRKVAEADQLAAKKAAEQASEAKSRFLAAITHELRTPLHGILGYAELLDLEGGLNSTTVATTEGHDGRWSISALDHQRCARCVADRSRSNGTAASHH